mgnify:CR=1 FL=1
MITTPSENSPVKMKFGTKLPSEPDPNCIFFTANAADNEYNVYLGSTPVRSKVIAITEDEINNICK